MHRAMMDTAEGHGEFIAGLAPKRPRLQVAQVMRVGGLATANEAWLLGDGAKVLPVAVATRCGHCEYTLVDAVRVSVDSCGGDRFCTSYSVSSGRSRLRKLLRSRLMDNSDSRLFKRLLHALGISCDQPVLGDERLTCPGGRTFSRGDAANFGQ